ncbi:MAG: sigma-70 family RNA polymerase sigma factor [Planctomycetota bacterium]
MARCPTASSEPRSSEARYNAARQPGMPDDPTSEAFRGRLMRLAVKLVWNREDAEDTVQEAFKLAMAKGPRQSGAALRPWLYRTVCNLCLNLRRRRRPEPLMPWLDVAEAAAPDSRLRRAEALSQLRAAIDRLPEQQRLALVLRTMERMDYARIAEIMTLSVSAVRAHVHLARRGLAEMLAGREDKRKEVRP